MEQSKPSVFPTAHHVSTRDPNSKIDRRLFSVDQPLSPSLESSFFLLFIVFGCPSTVSLPSVMAAGVRFIITHGILTSPGRHTSSFSFCLPAALLASSRGLLKSRDRESTSKTLNFRPEADWLKVGLNQNQPTGFSEKIRRRNVRLRLRGLRSCNALNLPRQTWLYRLSLWIKSSPRRRKFVFRFSGIHSFECASCDAAYNLQFEK